MTHDIIGQQLDEALRLVERDEEVKAMDYYDLYDRRQGFLEYQARKVFRDFIEEYGAELAPYKLSEILENEKQRVQQCHEH